MNYLKLSSIAFCFFVLTFGTANANALISETTESNSTEIGIVANSTHDRVVVSFENNDKDQYRIFIEDEEGNTLHSEMVSQKGPFNKRYDLGELADGDYTIKVSNGSEVTTSEVLHKN